MYLLDFLSGLRAQGEQKASVLYVAFQGARSPSVSHGQAGSLSIQVS